jgi:hypothetical protein
MGCSFPCAWASSRDDANITETANAMQKTCKHRILRSDVQTRIRPGSVQASGPPALAEFNVFAVASSSSSAITRGEGNEKTHPATT